MAEMVCSALVQETVSRGVSFALGMREEKASQGHLTERLEMAVSHLEFALERAQELQIRHLSLIMRLKQIKCAYVEAMELLDKHRQQQAVPPGQELQDAHRVKKRKLLWVISAKNMLTTSSFAGLSTDDVRRFELYADYAARFVRDVESGCSLRHYTFCNPIVRRLLEGKYLHYYLKQGNLVRDLFILPTYSDERGVEAELSYNYKDSTMAEKCFSLLLSLRLSESTDIVGLAIKGLQFLTCGFKQPAECAMAELTLVPNLQLQEIAPLAGPRLVHLQEQAQFSRPDPACCKGSRHGLCAKDIVSSGLADIFPEQVIYCCFRCYYVPALESSTRMPIDEVGRGCKPPLKVTMRFRPHFESLHYFLTRYLLNLLKRKRVKINKYIYAEETIGHDVEKYSLRPYMFVSRKPCFLPRKPYFLHKHVFRATHIEERREYIDDVSVQEVVETVKSNTISSFSRQPELREYRIDWSSRHGTACFVVENARVETARVPRTSKRYNTRSSKNKDK